MIATINMHNVQRIQHVRNQDRLIEETGTHTSRIRFIMKDGSDVEITMFSDTRLTVEIGEDIGEAVI